MKKDLRVIKTIENIEGNFLHLLSHYSFKNITIQMIISSSKINKSTFYRHYQDKYDLLNQIEAAQINSFKKPSLQFRKELSKKTILQLINYFEENKELLLILDSKELPIDIFGDMHQILSNDISYYFKDKTPISTLFSQLIANNILLTIKWAHKNKETIPPNQLTQIIMISINTGLEQTNKYISKNYK